MSFSTCLWFYTCTALHEDTVYWLTYYEGCCWSKDEKKNLPCTAILRGSQEAQQKPWELVISNCTCHSWSVHCDLDGTFLRGSWIPSNVCPAILWGVLLRMESSSHAIRKEALLSSMTWKGKGLGQRDLLCFLQRTQLRQVENFQFGYIMSVQGQSWTLCSLPVIMA